MMDLPLESNALRTIPLFTILLLTGSLSVHGQGGDIAKARDPGQELLALEREWNDAIMKRDTMRLDRILAGDYVLTTPEGLIVTKGELLEFFRSPEQEAVEVKGVGHDRTSVRVYGDTAVVISRFTMKVRAGGRPMETPFQHTDVFVKQRGSWRCVARHATRVADVDVHAGGDKPARGGDGGSPHAKPPADRGGITPSRPRANG